METLCSDITHLIIRKYLNPIDCLRLFTVSKKYYNYKQHYKNILRQAKKGFIECVKNNHLAAAQWKDSSSSEKANVNNEPRGGMRPKNSPEFHRVGSIVLLDRMLHHTTQNASPPSAPRRPIAPTNST